MDKEFKYCPFCGCDEATVYRTSDKRALQVVCPRCGAAITRTDREMLAPAWNRRLEWSDMLPDKNRVIWYLRDLQKDLASLEVSAKSTGLLVQKVLEGMGYEPEEVDEDEDE